MKKEGKQKKKKEWLERKKSRERDRTDRQRVSETIKKEYS